MLNTVLSKLTLLDGVLFLGIVWLSGVFLWLIKKFVSSYEKNTSIMTKVETTLDSMDRKLDTAADRDVEIIRALERVNTRHEFRPKVVSDQK